MAVTLFRGARLSSRVDAAELLRPFRDDPVAMRELRRTAAERYPALDVSLLGDDEVVDLVARSLSSGSLVVEAFDAGFAESPSGPEARQGRVGAA